MTIYEGASLLFMAAGLFVLVQCWRELRNIRTGKGDAFWSLVAMLRQKAAKSERPRKL